MMRMERTQTDQCKTLWWIAIPVMCTLMPVCCWPALKGTEAL